MRTAEVSAACPTMKASRLLMLAVVTMPSLMFGEVTCSSSSSSRDLPGNYVNLEVVFNVTVFHEGNKTLTCTADETWGNTTK